MFVLRTQKTMSKVYRTPLHDVIPNLCERKADGCKNKYL